MSFRSAVALIRLASLYFLTGCPTVAFLADVYPAQVAPIVLISALAVGALPGLLLARALQRGREAEFAARYRRLEGPFFLVAAVSLAGLMVRSAWRGGLGHFGFVVSAIGLFAASCLLLKAAPGQGPGIGIGSAPQG